MKLLFNEGLQSMRMNYYPPCPEPEKVISLNPHSDPLGITFLLNLNEIEGLQIKKDGIWIPVKPLPNSFIVNIGDALEVISFSKPISFFIDRNKIYEFDIQIYNNKFSNLYLLTF